MRAQPAIQYRRILSRILNYPPLPEGAGAWWGPNWAAARPAAPTSRSPPSIARPTQSGTNTRGQTHTGQGRFTLSGGGGDQNWTSFTACGGWIVTKGYQNVIRQLKINQRLDRLYPIL